MWCLTSVSKLWSMNEHQCIDQMLLRKCWDGKNVSKVSWSPVTEHWPGLYNVMEYPYLLLDLFHRWACMHLPLVFTSQNTIPASLATCFCETLFIPFVSVFLWNASWYETNCHHPYIDSTVLSMCFSHCILKCLKIFENFADEKLTNILIATFIIK